MTGKKRLIHVLIPVLAGVILLAGCESDETGRWYSSEQVVQGGKVYAEHCADCHGGNAEATANWKQTDADGNYPPPPLNGTAHAWHHSLEVLREQIVNGGAPLGGVMPSFAQVLDSDEIDATIAYFQSTWPDEIYQKWANHFETETMPSIGGN